MRVFSLTHKTYCGKKIHLTKWETITKPKTFGGLGLKNSSVMNTLKVNKETKLNTIEIHHMSSKTSEKISKYLMKTPPTLLEIG